MKTNRVREKSKLEKWIERYLKAKCIGYSITCKSRYYKFNTRIIRISDHIASSSDGDISIILDSSDQGHFIVHAPRTGEISVLNYEQTKQVIRSIKFLPSVMYIANTEKDLNVLPKDVKPEDIVIEPKKIDPRSCVLGFHISMFRTGQQQAIFNMVNKIKNEQKQKK